MDVNLDVLKHTIGTLVLENLSLRFQVESLRRMLSPQVPEKLEDTSARSPLELSLEHATSNPPEPPSAGS